MSVKQKRTFLSYQSRKIPTHEKSETTNDILGRAYDSPARTTYQSKAVDQLIRSVAKKEKKSDAQNEIDDNYSSPNYKTTISIGKRKGSYDDLIHLTSKPIQTERSKYTNFNLTGGIVKDPSEQ